MSRDIGADTHRHPLGDLALEEAVQHLLATDPTDADAVLRAAESLHGLLGERLRVLDG